MNTETRIFDAISINQVPMLYAVGAAIETFRNLDPTPEEVNEVKNECIEKVVISVTHRGVVVVFSK